MTAAIEVSLQDAIGIAQAVLLLAAAWLAWQAYKLNRTDHSEQRQQDQRGPRRRLLLDTIEELKELGHQLESAVVPGIGHRRDDLIQARQLRLRISVAFIPWAEQRDTCTAAEVEPGRLDRDAIITAATELNWNLRALDAGMFDGETRLTYRDTETGDLPPIHA